MQKLSAYILTYNSEKYLPTILENIQDVVDEILIIDSGSNDKTKEITATFEKAKFIYKPFSDFKSQRSFAANNCRYDYLLFLDSDELPDQAFISGLKQLKEKGFDKDAYEAERHWNVLGKNVGCIYPIVSPDFPIRLYNKNLVNFENSSLVHETPGGYRTKGRLMGKIQHISFENIEVLEKKLQFYTDIAAADLILKNKKLSSWHAYKSAIAAFVKWYIFKKGFLDAYTGIQLGRYAYRYSLLKYLKAIKIRKEKTQSTSS
jgi:glycosyltransferase involved in cell wall biosynthesis